MLLQLLHVSAPSRRRVTRNEKALVARVAAMTERSLLDVLEVADASSYESLEQTLELVAATSARVYLEASRSAPRFMAAAARCAWTDPVRMARDRFAFALAGRVARFFPDENESGLADTLRMVTDATMGMMMSELGRSAEPDVDLWGERIADLACSLLHGRHDVRVD
jgi:hypothetical protein